MVQLEVQGSDISSAMVGEAMHPECKCCFIAGSSGKPFFRVSPTGSLVKGALAKHRVFSTCLQVSSGSPLLRCLLSPGGALLRSA